MKLTMRIVFVIENSNISSLNLTNDGEILCVTLVIIKKTIKIKK